MKENKYILRSYNTGDEAGITSLFKTVFGKNMSIEQWKWKYLSTGGKLYTKIAQDSTGRIIAHAGAIFLRGILEGITIPFFQIADVMVHPEYRGYMGKKNLFKSIMKALFEDISKDFDRVLCYGFPGRRPYILGKRIRVYEAIEEAIEFIKLSNKTQLTLYKIKSLNWDDRRVNDLWKGISKNYKLSLIRDTEYLLWRYASNPFFSYKFFGIFAFGSLRGWFVTRQEDKKVFIVDLLVEREKIKEALKAIENYFFSKKNISIHLWLPENWKCNIDNYEEKRTGVIVTNMIWQLTLKTNLVRDKLYYTMGDVDIF